MTRRGRAGRHRRASAAVLLAGVLLLALAPPATGQVAPAGSTASTTTIVLRDRTAWVGDGFDFVLTAAIDGAPADATVRLTVHDRVRSRSEFSRSLVGQGLRTARHRSAEVPLAQIDPEADGVVTVAVPLVARDGVDAIALGQPGVYPVAFEVRAGGEQLAVLRTYLVRLARFDPEGDAAPLDVVVVLPVHAAPAHRATGQPSAPDLPLAEIAGALGAHPEVAVTVAPTPETIDAAAITDAATTSGLVATLTDREVLAGPWVGLDEAAWAQADRGELDRQLDQGRRTLVEVLDADPSGLRLVPAGATAATTAVMADAGATGFVLAADELEPVDNGDFRFTLTRPFALDVDGAPEGETLPALVSDTQLGAIAATAGDDPVLAASNLLADLAVLASDQPSLRRVATIVLPPTAARSGAFLDALLGGLEPPPAPPAPPAVPDPADPTVLVTPPATPAAAAVLVARSVSVALAEVEPAGVDGEPDPEDPLVRALAGDAPPTDVTGAARAVEAGRADLATFGTVFGDDDPLHEELDLLVATSAAAELGDGERAAIVGAVRAAVDGRVAALHAPESQRVTLTARQGRIQLVLANDSGVPANVVLVLRGDRLVLPDAPDGRLPVRLTDQQTRVDVEVEARSSGEVTLDLVLMTPDERIELGRSRIIVRATAVSGVGVLLLGASAAFLVVWWTRTIVQERRHARRRHPAHARGDT